MMEELKKYKLGEICKITSSKRIFEKEYVDGGIPFIRGQEISDGSIANPSSGFLCYISPERYEELKKSYGVPKKNDILITAVGTIGNTYLVEDNKKFYFKDGNIIWFKNIKKEVYPLYLLFFMKSPFFNQQIEYSLIGAVQKALTIVMLSKIEISLPSLATQRKIATVLSNIDRKISVNRQINRNLEELAKQIYDYWFVQFDFPNEDGKPYKSSGGKMMWNELLKREIPVGWEVKPLKNLLSCEISGDWGEDIVKGNRKYKVHCIRGCDMSDMSCLPERYIFPSNMGKQLKENDFVIEISGGSPTQSTGRIVQITKEILNRFDNRIICSNFCHGIRLANTSFVSFFLKLWDMFYENKIFFNFEGKTSGLKNFQFDIFINQQWYFPQEKLAKQYNEFVSELKKQIDKNESEIQELTSLRDTLLPLLMNGQVTLNSCLSHD